MYDLITATKCLSLLKSQDKITYSKSYFSQMVTDGKIPSHSKQGSPKKFFKYEEVKQAIEDTKDPTRDAQREANDKRREEPTNLFGQEGKYPSEADCTLIELAQRREDERVRREAEDAKREALAEMSSDEDGEAPASVTIAGAKAEKEYWLGLKAKHQVQEMTGHLISIDDAKAALEALLSPLNKSLDDLGVNFKAHFPSVPSEAVEWLIGHINDTKESLRGHKW